MTLAILSLASGNASQAILDFIALTLVQKENLVAVAWERVLVRTTLNVTMLRENVGVQVDGWVRTVLNPVHQAHLDLIAPDK